MACGSGTEDPEATGKGAAGETGGHNGWDSVVSDWGGRLRGCEAFGGNSEC